MLTGVWRQQRQIALNFPVDAEPHLIGRGSRRTPGTLVVHVHPHRVFARWTPLTGMDNPPVFHGHVEHRPDGFTISGTIRETRAVAILPFAFLVVCASGVLLAGTGIVSGYERAVSVAVGAPLAILFGVLFVLSLRRRRPRFRRQAGELEYGIDTCVRTGDVSRSTI